MRRLAFVTCVSAVALSLTACYLPFSGFGLDDDEILNPTILATYSSGSATAQITRDGVNETVQFDRVGAGSSLRDFSGATITWRNDGGWVLSLSAYDIGGVMAPRASGATDLALAGGDVTLQRVSGVDVWRADSFGASGNRCIVDLDEASATAVRGTATCRGLRWADGFQPAYAFDPVYIEGEEPFDAELAFEAVP